MNAGMPINDTILEILFQAAKRIVREKVNQVRIKEDGCEGSIETRYQFACIGSASGIKFTSTIDSENGTRKTTFIVPESELGIEQGTDKKFMWLHYKPDNVAAEKAWLN
jgi:hypothetical protein